MTVKIVLKLRIESNVRQNHLRITDLKMLTVRFSRQCGAERSGAVVSVCLFGGVAAKPICIGNLPVPLEFS